MIPAAWQQNELSHKYGGGNLFFLEEVATHPNFVRLVEFSGDGPKPRLNKVFTARKDLVKVRQSKINGTVREYPMDDWEKQQVAELRDRIAKGEDCIHNGYVVAKGGKA